MQGITLIGMPASGKSSIGKSLADELGWKFVDLDALIQEKTGLTPAQFISEKNENEFIQLEEELTMGLDLDQTVFAPGGSIIYSARAMNKLKEETKVVYLNLPLEEIKKRLGAAPFDRGIVGLARWGLDGLFQERKYLYQAYAHHSLDLFGITDQAAIEEIKKLA